MTASTDSTGDRIIAAATEEFARYGIAGARVERIARTARTSKERVYAYHRSKEQLYRFVAGRELAAMGDAVQLDPANLPGYAGRVHDHLAGHPQRHRLMMWGQLELPPGEAPPDDPFQASIRHKVQRIREAQQTGDLDPAWAPEDVMMFVSQIATSWSVPTGLSGDSSGRDAFLAARRAAIVMAVQRLFPAATGSHPPHDA
ncbi:TetR family transcriptional regulator [Actinoplanes couchii]|uniref:TetR family transcriptional regulator n=1 Tax=Actinoplanes couchii TaxID=403638 RepID=UPI0019412317|nr:TetR family transcriptional regulator [Actinoplanes couchii]MDR6318185.1 AcrR family transcriptional regulator [Actinoplanes couchii]